MGVRKRSTTFYTCAIDLFSVLSLILMLNIQKETNDQHYIIVSSAAAEFYPAVMLSAEQGFADDNFIIRTRFRDISLSDYQAKEAQSFLICDLERDCRDPRISKLQKDYGDDAVYGWVIPDQLTRDAQQKKKSTCRDGEFCVITIEADRTIN